jgi:hypothetical protein
LNDSATVTGGFNPTGTVTFNLFGPSDPTCSGTPAYTQTVGLSGGSASTSPGFVTNAAGTWNWTASYSGDANNSPATSGCGAESVTVTNPHTGQITPTNTTCTQFNSGTAGTLGEVDYQTKTQKNAVVISNDQPGVFFYYIKLVAPAASWNADVTFTPTTPTWGVSGVFAYDASCNTWKKVTFISTNPSDVKFNFTGTTTGATYIIAVKYSAKAIVGQSAPTPRDVTYTFQAKLNGSVVPNSDNNLLLHKTSGP